MHLAQYYNSLKLLRKKLAYSFRPIYNRQRGVRSIGKLMKAGHFLNIVRNIRGQ